MLREAAVVRVKKHLKKSLKGVLARYWRRKRAEQRRLRAEKRKKR